MLYAFISQDVAATLDKRLAARPGHIKRLQQLRDEGTGSLVVAEFDSLQEAQDWAKSDPYVAAGVYASVTVKPFKRVLP